MRRGHTSTTPRLSWCVHGQGAQPVLLIMGFRMAGEAWRPQIDGLKAHHPVITYDARGIGESAPMQGGLTILDMAEDALRVLNDVGFDKVHLVGVSMGGMVAQELALLAPSRFHSVTLIATHSGGPTVWLPALSSLKDLILFSFGPKARRLEHMEQLLYPESFRRSCEREALDGRMQACFSPVVPPETLKAQLGAVRGHRTHRRLKQLHLPTLVVRADQDRMIAAKHVDRLMKVLPKAKLVAFEDAGHGLIYQRAEALNRAMLEHFAEHA